jgi:hypothetical protein
MQGHYSSGVFNRLEAFTKKYYINLLNQGLLLTLSVVTGLFLVFALINGLFFLPPMIRGFLFYGFLFVALTLFIVRVIKPFFGYLGLRRELTHERAAAMIGQHFPEIEDKLLNLLELQKQEAADVMVQAAIKQKENQFQPFSFVQAIDFKDAYKFLKSGLAVLVFGLLIWVSGQWYLVKSGSDKLVNYSKVYIPEAPFQLLLPDDLVVTQGSDFELSVQILGTMIPDEVIVQHGPESGLMRQDQSTFSFTFRRVQSATRFTINAAGFMFGPYELEVLFPPSLNQLELKISPPLYTKLDPITLDAFSDLMIPEGSELSVLLYAVHTEQLLLLADTKEMFFDKQQNQFTLNTKISQGFIGQVVGKGIILDRPLSGKFQVSIVPDMHPSLQIRMFRDSIALNRLFFEGQAEDDYGLRKVGWKILDSEKKVLSEKFESISGNMHFIRSTINLSDIKSTDFAGASLVWEVWDNDGVNGSKVTKSQIFPLDFFHRSSIMEKQKEMEQQSAKAIAKQIQDLKKQQDRLEKANQNSMNQKDQNWRNQNQMKELMEQQNKLLRQLEDIKENRDKQRAIDDNESLFSEQLLEKQKKIDELLDELADDEMRKLMDEIQKLMEDLKKDGLQDKMQQLQMENQHLMDQMERYLDMLEQLKFEKGIEEVIQKLEELEEKQGALIDKERVDPSEQNALQESLKDAEKQVKDLEEKDKSLKKPNGFDGPKEDMKEAGQKMKESSENMQNKQNPKSQQKQAKEKVSDAKKAMMDFQANMAAQQNTENMKHLRQILENLLVLSFDQEQLMEEMRTEGKNSPKYSNFMRRQRSLKDNSKIIADSLYALSKRVEQISAFVQKEMLKIDRSFDKSLDFFAERELGRGLGEQQFVMTSSNNLANLLHQALEQMQQQQAMQMDGNQQCQKPGQGKGSMESLKKMQEQLAQELGKMQNGEQGEPKPGQKGARMSKEIVEMMARQEKIRKAAENALKEGQEAGGKEGNKGLQELIDQMKKNEEDLANQKFDKQFYERQQEILTRLLEYETADLKQKQDEQRIGETAASPSLNKGGKYEEYLRQREAQIEKFKFAQPAFRQFYMQKQRETQSVGL